MSKLRHSSSFKQKKDFKPKGTAIEYALRSVTAKLQTEKQIRDKIEKYYPDVNHDEVMDRLKELEYIDDKAFCAAWVRHRSISSPRGAFALRRELQMKGIPAHIIEAELEHADFSNELRDLAESKWPSILRREENSYKQKEKLMRFLISRGFQMTEVLEVVNQIASELRE